MVTPESPPGTLDTPITAPPAVAVTTRWLARFKGPIVAIAGVGAVLSGLVGWYTTYKTVAGTQLAASEATSAAKLSDAGPLSILVLPLANQNRRCGQGLYRRRTDQQHHR